MDDYVHIEQVELLQDQMDAMACEIERLTATNDALAGSNRSLMTENSRLKQQLKQSRKYGG